MHILLTAYGYPTKTTKGNPFVKELAEALAARGVKVSILNYVFLNPLTFLKGFFGNGFTNWQETKGVNFVNAYYINFLPSWSFFIPLQKQLIFLAIRVRLYLYSIKYGKFSFIQQHYIVNAQPWITQYLSKAFKIPYVLFEHSPLTDLNFVNQKLGVYYSKSELIPFVKGARLRVARTPVFSDIYAKLFGCKFEAIPNFIPKLFVNVPISTNSAAEKFIFINIGTLILKKHQDRLIKAFSMAFKDEKNVELNIIGEGEQRLKLQQLIRELNLEERVKLLGLKSRVEVIDSIDQSNAIVIASDLETFGNTVLEAFSRGKPVLSTKCGGPETLINNSNGLLVEKSVEGLAKGLVEMKSTYSNFNSTQIRENLITEFSETKIIERILSLYNSK